MLALPFTPSATSVSPLRSRVSVISLVTVILYVLISPFSAVTTTFKVTGVYPIFTNGIEAGYDSDNKPTGETISVPTEGVDGKLSLKNTGATFVVSYASQGKKAKRYK